MTTICICPHCGLKFEQIIKGSFASHVRWCKENPKRQKYIDDLKQRHIDGKCKHRVWNKGQTAQTNEKIRKCAETRKKHILDGSVVIKGHPHSEESKEKIRQKQLQNHYQRVCKSSFYYKRKNGEIVKLDSSYEKIVADFLEKYNIDWIRPQEPLEWIDSFGKKRNYYPDFYIPSYGIYLDPKNDYCFNAQKEKIEYIIEKYENVKFLHKKDLNENFLISLIDYNIKILDENYSGEIIKSVANKKPLYFCKNCGKEIRKGSTYCRHCTSVISNSIRSKIPKMEILADMIKKFSISEIAKEFNVSYTAVSKWIKKYNLKK